MTEIGFCWLWLLLAGLATIDVASELGWQKHGTGFFWSLASIFKIKFFEHNDKEIGGSYLNMKLIACSGFPKKDLNGSERTCSSISCFADEIH